MPIEKHLPNTKIPSMPSSPQGKSSCATWMDTCRDATLSIPTTEP